MKIWRLFDSYQDVVWEGDGDEHVFSKTANGGFEGWSSHLAPRLLTTLLDGALVVTRSDSSSVERVRVGEESTPWFDYPESRTPVAPGRFPMLEGGYRYDVFPESQSFLSSSPGSAWLVLRNPNDLISPYVHLQTSGAVEYVDPGAAGYRPLFIGENHLVALNHSDLGVQYVTVHELLR